MRESMSPFEQAWSLLKSQLTDRTIFQLNGKPRIGGQQNSLYAYPGQMFFPRASDTYRAPVPTTGPTTTQNQDAMAQAAMASRYNTMDEMMEDQAGRERLDLYQSQPALPVQAQDLANFELPTVPFSNEALRALNDLINTTYPPPTPAPPEHTGPIGKKSPFENLAALFG